MAMSEQYYKEQVVKNLSQINKSLSEIAMDCKVGRTSNLIREKTQKDICNEEYIKGALMVINYTNIMPDGYHIPDETMLLIENKLKEKGWNGHYGNGE